MPLPNKPDWDLVSRFSSKLHPWLRNSASSAAQIYILNENLFFRLWARRLLVGSLNNWKFLLESAMCISSGGGGGCGEAHNNMCCAPDALTHKARKWTLGCCLWFPVKTHDMYVCAPPWYTLIYAARER
jgi:hypothetical protein